MALHTRRTGNSEYGRFIKALVCGEPGSGKTLISSTFPNPYFASIEGGMMSIAAKHLPYLEISSSEEMFELRTYLSLDDPAAREAMIGCKVETVVIDTLDEYQSLLVRERLESERRDKMTLPDFGWLSEQMQTFIRAFRNLNMHVVFTCHLKETKDEESGKVVYKPGMQGQIADKVPGFVDLSLLLTSHIKTEIVGTEARPVIKRQLQTFPDPQHPWIKDRSGKLPTELPVNFEDDFTRINKYIFDGIDVGPTTDVSSANAPAAAVPAPVQEVKAEVPVPTVAAPEGGSTFECESCGTSFDNSDQAELSKLRSRKILCSPCYKTAMTTKRQERK